MSGQNAQHREKEILGEKRQKTFVELLPKTKWTQTIGLVFADRIEQVKKKFEIALV